MRGFRKSKNKLSTKHLVGDRKIIDGRQVLILPCVDGKYRPKKKNYGGRQRVAKKSKRT